MQNAGLASGKNNNDNNNVLPDNHAIKIPEQIQRMINVI